jgi:hypothetical protein
MVEASNAEALVENELTRSTALALDSALFDNNVATTTRPAGLRAGINALSASTGPDPMNAMLTDIDTLWPAWRQSPTGRRL